MSHDARPVRPSDPRKWANEFDCDLYRLMARAESRQLPAWDAVAADLRRARVKVRPQMHPNDRKGTEGCR